MPWIDFRTQPISYEWLMLANMKQEATKLQTNRSWAFQLESQLMCKKSTKIVTSVKCQIAASLMTLQKEKKKAQTEEGQESARTPDRWESLCTELALTKSSLVHQPRKLKISEIKRMIYESRVTSVHHSHTSSYASDFVVMKNSVNVQESLEMLAIRWLMMRKLRSGFN